MKEHSNHCYVVKCPGVEVVIVDFSQLTTEEELLTAISDAKDFLSALPVSFGFQFSIVDLSHTVSTEKIRIALRELDTMVIRRFGVSLLRNKRTNRSVHMTIAPSRLQYLRNWFQLENRQQPTQVSVALMEILRQYA